MSTALLLRRARSSSLIRPSSLSCLHQSSESTVVVSPRAISSCLHNHSWSSRATTTAILGSNSIDTLHRIQATVRQKSAMPIAGSMDNDDDDDYSETPSPTSNSTPFLLADIGEGISEVELLQWFVSPGDTVVQFDRICEVQSDKAMVEITSRFDGVVEKLCGDVGDMMFVGKPLLYIATEASKGSVDSSTGSIVGLLEQQQQLPQEVVAQQPAPTLNNVDDEQDRLQIPSAGTKYSTYHEEQSAGASSSEGSTNEGRASSTKVLTSPAVRKLGKENNIDLGTIVGTGPGGRILKADVLKLLNNTNNAHGTNAGTSSDDSTNKQLSSHNLISSTPEQDTVIPIRGYNRLMVKSMTSSLEVPHMVYADEINVNALTEVRDALRPLAMEMGVPKLTYLPFFIKAASLSMKKYPVLNSTIDVEKMTLTHHVEHNIGVAVDTKKGLAVPVVRGCEGRSVLEIAMELNRLYALVSIFALMYYGFFSSKFVLSYTQQMCSTSL